jgi:hypothetical protein
MGNGMLLKGACIKQRRSIGLIQQGHLRRLDWRDPQSSREIARCV